MSQIGASGSGLSRPSGENDVYTALILVAFLFVLAATIYVGYIAQSYFGTLLPPGGS
jgi:flagellin-like protein